MKLSKKAYHDKKHGTWCCGWRGCPASRNFDIGRDWLSVKRYGHAERSKREDSEDNSEMRCSELYGDIETSAEKTEAPGDISG